MDKDNNSKVIINSEKNNKILLRKKELFHHLDEKKLQYVQNGICDSYIKYGVPALHDVVSNIELNTELNTKRLLRLIKKLKKEGEIYDENISYYKNYIRNGGDIDYTVNEGIKEWFFINKTNYVELLKVYKDIDRAQAKALNVYINTYGNDKYTERIIGSEMSIKLY